MRPVDDQDPENVLQSFDAIFVRLISFKTLFDSLYTPPHFIIVASPGCEIGNLLPGLLDPPDRLLPVLLGLLPLVEAGQHHLLGSLLALLPVLLGLPGSGHRRLDVHRTTHDDRGKIRVWSSIC